VGDDDAATETAAAAVGEFGASARDAGCRRRRGGGGGERLAASAIVSMEEEGRGHGEEQGWEDAHVEVSLYIFFLSLLTYGTCGLMLPACCWLMMADRDLRHLINNLSIFLF
jgi:hypothetical protein